ncbi:short-chain fatty acid transporter [Ferviditalea candida]|uniref:TIGR00366 family protein n=1 Tax=Ferviditalea candida TaxID=3108399 RepID=A0ABU5ZG79_9BACL|nr:TIGR00366 family protein [Paenibacillaceae bacterium T2]
MIQRLGNVLTRVSYKYLPDPFIFAILLSLVVFIMGIVIAGQTPFQMVLHWQNGFWQLLTFSMQMALIIVLGYAVADSPIVNRWLKALAATAKNSRQAVYIVALVAVVGGLISWGFGLVLGALFAREMGKSGYQRGIKMHYPLLGTAAYLSMMVWHAGLSGSAPLLVATKGHFLESKIGIIPITETLFNPMNITVIIASLVLVPLFALWVHPKNNNELLPIDAIISREELAATAELQATYAAEEMTPASRLDNSRILSWIVGLGGLIYIVYYFSTKGFNLTLDILNAIFLFVGILLHGTPMRYVKSVAEGTKGVSGVLLQFPFYAGIMGMMQSSGLVAIIAQWFVAISTTTTYPLYTYISACIVNLFVPSGGGQWAVQGPIMVEAAPALGVSYPKTIMALAYGDQLTNMVQPFWAIALLGITGLKARDVIGYAAAIMFMGFFIFAIATFLPA